MKGGTYLRGWRPLVALVAAAALLATTASSALASSGQITRAETNASWTRGSFAWSASWTDCPPACSWTPVATVQPSLPSYSCQGDEGLDSDPNTQVIWSGGGRSGNGQASADISDVPILQGVQGQRVCLSALATSHIQDPVCIAQAPILGYDPSTCPYVDRIYGQSLANRLLTVGTGSSGAANTSTKAKSVKKCKKKFPKGPRRKKCLKKAKKLSA